MRLFNGMGFMLAGTGSAVLFVLMFPPFNISLGGFVFALPLLIWATKKSPDGPHSDKSSGVPFPQKPFLKLLGLCSLAWMLTIIWLRHVYPPHGWLGLIIVSLYLGFFLSLWLTIALRLTRSRCSRSLPFQIARMLLLSCLWVFLEWCRSWFLSGFPWLPLAASQWTNPSVLRMADTVGASGISFALIFTQLAVAEAFQCLKTLFAAGNREKHIIRWTGLLPLGLGIAFFGFSIARYALEPQRPTRLTLRVALIQPWKPPLVESNPDQDRASLERLRHLTEAAVSSDLPQQPDLILWPEGATPYPMIYRNDRRQLDWILRLSDAVQVPIVLGNITFTEISDPSEAAEGLKPGYWTNGMFMVEAGQLRDEAYGKRQLVPFGEYVPMKFLFGWLGKVVPLPGNTRPGDRPGVFLLHLEEGVLSLGGLICYEDIFAHLARETADSGADVLIVVTDDSWYGQEAGSFQHLAHSVLRAVETGLPVIRCGNNGWSGWISPSGELMEVLADDQGSIYTIGQKTVTVSIPHKKPTFYTQNGNFVQNISIATSCGWLAISLLRRYIKPRDDKSSKPAP